MPFAAEKWHIYFYFKVEKNPAQFEIHENFWLCFERFEILVFQNVGYKNNITQSNDMLKIVEGFKKQWKRFFAKTCY